MLRHTVLAMVLAAGAPLLAGCGGGNRPSPGPQIPMEHIHGIGLNPRDGAVMVATHAGLFRSPRGSSKAERVGDRQQDTMGFTVVGPDRFLGSGHPDLRDQLPSSLGLIRSLDGGSSWKPISLLGRADLHTIRASGRRVYAFDALSHRFMASADEGRSWRSWSSTLDVIDIAIDPRDDERVIISTPSGPRLSRDGGDTWRVLSGHAPGLLLWTTNALHLVDAQGIVIASTDLGRTWTSVGTVSGRPVAAAAAGTELYVATDENAVVMSSNGGRTWRTRVKPSPRQGPTAIARGRTSPNVATKSTNITA